MSAATLENGGARIVHSVPGRVRINVPDWPEESASEFASRFRELPGVRQASANERTRNLLLAYDGELTSAEELRAAAQIPPPRSKNPPPEQPPPFLRDVGGTLDRVRIAVRGLDRDTRLGSRLVETLSRRPGVRRVSASALTGRVLVEFDARQVQIDDLLTHVTRLELPELPGEDRPTHPLDRAPLIQSTVRTAAAFGGLALLAGRRLVNATGPPTSSSVPVLVSALIGAAEGLPPVRGALRSVLGRSGAEVVFSGVGAISLTSAGSPLGLAVVAAGSLRLMSEIRARQAAWRAYEERLGDAPDAHPGTIVRLRPGERCPLPARILEGEGTWTDDAGLPQAACPNDQVPAGARLSGSEFVLELEPLAPFTPLPRPVPLPRDLRDRYSRLISPVALGYAALTALLTRSPSRALTALLLVNGRPALIGAESADTNAAARVLRGGVTVAGSRPGRVVRRTDLLLLDGTRLLSAGYEVRAAIPVAPQLDADQVLQWASGVAAASGSPWGAAFPLQGRARMSEGRFDAGCAQASLNGTIYRLREAVDDDARQVRELRERGHVPLALLQNGGAAAPLGILSLRPRLAPGIDGLAMICARHGTVLAVLVDNDCPGSDAIARRADLPLIYGDAVELIRARQSAGEVVGFASDSADAAPAFAASDLAIGFTTGRSSRFAARADLLAPDLRAITAIVDAGTRREQAIRDGVLAATAANLFGAVWGLRGEPGIRQGSHATYVGALAAMGASWLRLRGGRIRRATAAQLVDPAPERWGSVDAASALAQLGSRAQGLSAAQAAERYSPRAEEAPRSPLLDSALRQLRSPLIGVLAAGAGVSLVVGSAADVALIGAVILVNTAVGAWQEHQTDEAAAALERMGAAEAVVLRGGQRTAVAADQVVVGDVLLLSSGDRVAADARILDSDGLEIDEAALSGESLPIEKSADADEPAARVVLEGTDVTVGTGTAVVVAVGDGTRMGATSAALRRRSDEVSALGRQLNGIMRQGVPIVVAGGALVVLAGLARRRSLFSQLAIGASVATAAVPEGLPLIAGVGEAAVARRLVTRNALVKRLGAVETLGRVDVACADKTGTLTVGRLSLTHIDDFASEFALHGDLPEGAREILLAAALASPHPDAADAAAHPTDMVLIGAAESGGLGDALRVPRVEELAFDPTRSYYASRVGQRVLVKGAADVLLDRCASARIGGAEVELDAPNRAALLERAERLGAQGLRVLLVAEGRAGTPLDDPRDLRAIGLVGLSDPVRPGVRAAVQRCHEAGVRLIMLTGDHPSTARAIAEQAGLSTRAEDVLSGAELAELSDEELDVRLERATVVARITPLDKVRIVERLQLLGHTVAMTGDGVNDAPALRLADVGVAMGAHGTDVARQAADVVLTDDDFATLVEALVEGRSFWLNIRRALGLLLGGNLGEVGLMVSAGVLGLASPMSTRQILAVNLVTDVLPALAVASQQPEHRDLAALRREGAGNVDAALRRDVVRRAIATAVPSLAAFAVATRTSSPAQASSVAFASVVATQLTQTLALGRSEGTLSRPVLGAVGVTGVVVVAALTMPVLAGPLGFGMPSLIDLALIGAAGAASMLLSMRRETVASPQLLLPA